MEEHKSQQGSAPDRISSDKHQAVREQHEDKINTKKELFLMIKSEMELSHQRSKEVSDKFNEISQNFKDFSQNFKDFSKEVSNKFDQISQNLTDINNRAWQRHRSLMA